MLFKLDKQQSSRAQGGSIMAISRHNQVFEQLLRTLDIAWSRETAHPVFADKWSEENRSAGQCAVTALVVNDHFGGELAKTYVGDDSHYFNIIDGEVIDLTAQQFGDAKIDYENYELRTREAVLANENTRQRYNELRGKVSRRREGEEKGDDDEK